MNMNNLVLIGMPASGKSTIGVILAKTLGMNFIDADLIIQKNEKKLLQDIIDSEGIEKFLLAEERAIISLECNDTVIATGGSAVLSKSAMKHLKSIGKVIYISVVCEELEKRLDNIKTRGIACEKGQTPQQIFEQRKVLYEKYADVTINSLNNIEDTIKNILNSI